MHDYSDWDLEDDENEEESSKVIIHDDDGCGPKIISGTIAIMVLTILCQILIF